MKKENVALFCADTARTMLARSSSDEHMEGTMTDTARLRIFIEDSFDSAHSLPHLPEGHKCHNVHGHTYRIRIELRGELCPVNAWIVDYAEVKAAWNLVKDQIDHRNINDLMPISTCESFIVWIANRLALPVGVSLARIELRETERCGAALEWS